MNEAVLVMVSAAVTAIISQFLKVLVYRSRNLKWDMKIVKSDGETPSTHSAVVTSLTLSVFLVQGLSVLLVVTGVFALLVMRDSAGVRLAAQRHAVFLNKTHKQKFRERLGHTPRQILSGAIIGLLVTYLIHLLA